YNTGDYNIENCNTGYRNEGCCNEGCWNTGNYNIGNCNSGDWNIGDYNSGVFCTDVPKIRMFNKETDLTYEDWINSEARNILKRNSYLTKWIHIDDMTEEEKENNPGYEINNGYLKVFTFEEMCKNMWNNLTDEEKKIIIDIPNFDADIFKEITGIEVIKLKIKECNIVDKQEYTNCCGNCKECDEYHKMLCNSLYEEE
ncbi:pentapeptide repeat-containing protein, partial [Clostridioides difficile]